jgi:hypothetical protein
MEQLYLRFARWFVKKYIPGYHIKRKSFKLRKEEVVNEGN